MHALALICQCSLNKNLATLKKRYDDVDKSIPRSLPTPAAGNVPTKRVTPIVSGSAEGYALAATAILGLTTATQGLIKSQIRAAIQLERQKTSLQTITGSAGAAEAQYKRLLEVARLPGIDTTQALAASAQLQAIGLSGESAARAVGAFGNALATSGQSAQELGAIVGGFRQLTAEGKILQEDIAIITTRIPSLIPLMQEAFGGTRAADVRAYYESIGQADRQAELFGDRLISLLRTLPQVSDTAGNALENLADTATRVQALIGTKLLPLVKDAARGLEDALSGIERSSGVQTAIASLGTFGASLATIVGGVAAVRLAIPLLISTFGFLTGPLGIATLAVGGIVSGLLAWEVITRDQTDALPELDNAIANNTDAIKDNQEAIENRDKAAQKRSEQTLQERIRALNDTQKERNDTLDEERERLRDLEKRRDRYEEGGSGFGGRSGQGLNATDDEIIEASQNIANLVDSIKEGEEELDKLNRQAYKSFKDEVDADTKSVRELKTELQALREENLKGSGLSDVARQLLDGTTDLRRNIRNVARTIEAIDKLPENVSDSERAEYQKELNKELAAYEENYKKLRPTLKSVNELESERDRLLRVAAAAEKKGEIEAAKRLRSYAIELGKQIRIIQRVEELNKEAADNFRKYQRDKQAAARKEAAARRKEEADTRKRYAEIRKQQAAGKRAFEEGTKLLEQSGKTVLNRTETGIDRNVEDQRNLFTFSKGRDSSRSDIERDLLTFRPQERIESRRLVKNEALKFLGEIDEQQKKNTAAAIKGCLLYTSPSPRD